ncbi:MAG: hypothetical protein R3236_04760 [Phycisphaeraceae bacterium]|nr:hypothetical protein [Phycisphaeraceae bacterium]
MSHPLPLSRWIARQRWRHRILGLGLGAVLLILLVVRGRDALALRRWSAQAHRITAVHPDGRLVLGFDDRARHIGLQGVRLEKTEAVEWVRRHWVGRSVRLSFDFRQPVRGGHRPAAYVYDEQGRMLNEQLLREGLVRPGPGAHRLSWWFEQIHTPPANPDGPKPILTR